MNKRICHTLFRTSKAVRIQSSSQIHSLQTRNFFDKVLKFFLPSIPASAEDLPNEVSEKLKSRKIPTNQSQLIFTWGANNNGQLGKNDTKSDYVPTPLAMDFANNTKVKKIVAGTSHFLVLLENGQVFACGGNGQGQLGVGDFDDSLGLIPIKSLSKIVDIAAGDSTSAAIDDEGKLYTWGFCNKTTVTAVSPLGLGDNQGRNKPTLVEALQGEKLSQVSLGEKHSGVVNSNGELFMFGTGAWGRLGLGASMTNYLLPQKVTDFKESVLQLSLGKNYTTVLSQKNQVYVFGKNDGMALGFESTASLILPGNTDGESRPILLENLAKRKIVQVCSGDTNTLAIEDNGQRKNTWIWGKNYFEPTALKIQNATQVSYGKNHGGIVTEEGDLYMIGSSKSGQLTKETSLLESLNEVYKVDRRLFIVPGKVKTIKCGGMFSVALFEQQ